MAGYRIEPCGRPELPGELRLQAEQATAAVLRQVLDEIPIYRTLGTEELADVAETIRQGYLAALTMWEAGRLARPDQLQHFRANGATRAAEGRPLPTLLRSYRISSLGVFDYVLEHATPKLDGDEERNFARLVMAFVDQLSNEVTLGYVEASRQLSTQQERLRRELCDDVLAGRLSSQTELAERARTLGVSLARDPILIVASPLARDGTSLPDRAEILLQALQRHAGDEAGGPPLHVLNRGRLVLITERIDFNTLRRELLNADLTGIVLRLPDLADAAGAHRTAIELHDLLAENRLSTTGPIGDPEAQMLALLTNAARLERATSAITAILGELASPRHSDLIDTLDAYYATGNAVSAAHRLGLHPQTMRQRLRKVRDLTDRDLAHGQDRFFIELAIRLLKVRDQA